MFTVTLRECRSAVQDVKLPRKWVKPAGKPDSLTRCSPCPAYTHRASIPSENVSSHAYVTGIAPELGQHKPVRSSAEATGHHGESVRDLFREAQIARLAGYCYSSSNALKAHVADENLRVLASGDTYFTRWYIAAGTLTGNVPSENHIDLPEEDSTPGPRLHVFFRGIMWRNPEVETVRVWQKLSQSWGVPLVSSSDNVSETRENTAGDRTIEDLVVHAGILDMAEELFSELRPHLLKYRGRITLAGHSLGGTLALLIAAKLILEGDVKSTKLHVHCFGSPPVLSHTAHATNIGSNCGAAVRQRLGLPATHVRNWVQDFDPVPRATTAANPYLQVARRNEAFRTMYDLAGMAATALGVAHPAQRFFFRHVGHVFMLTHSDPTADCCVQKLPEASADEKLAEAPVVGRGEGFRPRIIARELLRSVLDHTHTSYANDLLVAATLALHRYGIQSPSTTGGKGSPPGCSGIEGHAVASGEVLAAVRRRGDCYRVRNGVKDPKNGVEPSFVSERGIPGRLGRKQLRVRADEAADCAHPSATEENVPLRHCEMYGDVKSGVMSATDVLVGGQSEGGNKEGHS